MAHPYNGILFYHKKEPGTDKRDEPQKHYASGQKSDAKGQMMVLFVCHVQKGSSTEK